MNFLELAESRHSCRAFENVPVEQEKVDYIFKAIQQAPSAGNLQAYSVQVVTDVKLKHRLAEHSCGQFFIAEAPIILVFFAALELSAERYGDRGMDLYCIQDATIACTYAHLAATEMGLGSCWIGAFNQELVHRCMNARWSWRAVAMLPIGYAAKQLTSPRKVSRIML
jgi:nitroreductase